MSKIIRKTPRVAGKGRVFFNSRAMPISVRNAPGVRRLKRKHRR